MRLSVSLNLFDRAPDLFPICIDHMQFGLIPSRTLFLKLSIFVS